VSWEMAELQSLEAWPYRGRTRWALRQMWRLLGQLLELGACAEVPCSRRALWETLPPLWQVET